MSSIETGTMPIGPWLDQYQESGFGAAALHPYYFQVEAIEAIIDHLWRHDSTLLVLPTGCGKTIVFGLIIKYVTEVLGWRVLVLAHRNELLAQAQNKLLAVGVDSVLEKAEQKGREDLMTANSGILPREVHTVVASVQTLRKNRLEKHWHPSDFHLIITDESHHSPADSYQTIYQFFDQAKHLGVTATAKRRDKINLGRVYQSIAYEYRLDRAIREGYLARLEGIQGDVEVDLRGIRTVGGDFNQGDLEDRIKPQIEQLANAVRENIGDRKGIVFTPDVESARLFRDALNSLDINSRAIHGKSYDRDVILKDFHEGTFQCLCNCALLTEGYDQPDVSFIALARPTRSWGLLAQMVGRGTRLAPGKKNCLLLDFAWQVDNKHKLVQPVHLIVPELDGDQAVSERSLGLAEAKTSTNGEPADLLDAWEAADAQRKEEERVAAEEAEKERIRQDRQERQRQEEEYRRKMAVKNRSTGWQYRTFDPVGTINDLTGIATASPKQIQHYPVTPAQKTALVNFGIPSEEVDSMSKWVASRHIDWCIQRNKTGLCTIKQARLMIKKGLGRDEALEMTKQEASQWIDRALNGRPQPERGFHLVY